jgi:[ribosomal protein S5]-alanine N-acetyltransferase
VPVERVERGSVILRRPHFDDAVALHEVESDPEVWRLHPHRRPTDVDQTRESLGAILDHWEEHGFGYWIVEDAGRVVGSGGIQRFDLKGERVLNVYYRLAPDVHGRGIASFILQSALNRARQVAPELPVVVRTDLRNLAAQRVAEKAGFKPAEMETEVEDPLLVLRQPQDVQAELA